METVGDLLRLVDRSEYAIIRDRMRSVILRRRGRTLAAIGAMLGRTEMWVKRWNDRFKSDGLAGLKNRSAPGGKSLLSAETEAKVARRIAELSGQIRTITDVRLLLEREFFVRYSKSGAAGLLGRLGLVKLRPRPRHPESDPARQAEFVAKDLPLFVLRSTRRTLANESKFGMKRALGSKGV